MLLAKRLVDGSSHRFCYARILGIYHANVQYIGPGLRDYNPRRLDFAHVRWYELVTPDAELDGVALDMLQLVSMDDPDAFDFINPAEILRGCHLIPAFAKSRTSPDSDGSFPSANGSKDWKYYYVNKYGNFPHLRRSPSDPYEGL